MQPSTPKDPLKVLIRSIMRLKREKLNYEYNRFIQSIWAKMNFKETTTSDDHTLIKFNLYVRGG